jgi:putative ABC transport system substrate-binding protein
VKQQAESLPNAAPEKAGANLAVTNDPVALGLVVSFARPGGNATGINFPLAEVAVKELGLLHEVVPAARRIGLLVNPNNSPSAAVTKDVTAAASAWGSRSAWLDFIRRRDGNPWRVGRKLGGIWFN